MSHFLRGACHSVEFRYLVALPPHLSDGLRNLQRFGTSLVAQWLRIHLPMQGTRVRALVQEDPTCHATTEARVPRARAPQQEKPPQ